MSVRIIFIGKYLFSFQCTCAKAASNAAAAEAAVGEKGEENEEEILFMTLKISLSTIFAVASIVSLSSTQC